MQTGRLAFFERYRSEFSAYAFAISHFSNFDWGLLSVFSYLDERPQRDSVNAYWKISSCRGRFCWIESQIRKKLPQEDDFVCSWSSIRDRLDDAINVRNQLAHGQLEAIIISENEVIVGYWPELTKNATTSQLSLNEKTRLIEGTPYFSPDRLIETGLEFLSLGDKLDTMVPRVYTPEGSKPARLVERPRPE